MTRPLIESLDNRRLFATYAPDVTFASDGNLPTLTDAAPFVAVRDGGIITGGLFRDETTGPQLQVARFHADGTNDRDFHSGARLLGDEARAVSIVGADLQARPFLTASKGNIAYITRLRAQGSRDRAFAATLKPLGSTLQATTVDQVQSTADGSVLAVVRVTGGSGVSTYIAKLSNTGQLDFGFGLDGYAAIGRAKFDRSTPNGSTPPAVWFTTDASSRIYVSVEGQHSVVRLRVSGGRDAGFGTNGVISTLSVAFDPTAALDSAGRLLLYDPSAFWLRRYTQDGTPDSTFGTDGHIEAINLTGGSTTVTVSVLPQSDSLLHLQVDKAVVRYRSDGTLDARFGSNGLARLTEGGKIEALLPGGRFLQRNGSDLQAVARLQAVALGHSGTLYLNGTAASDTVTIHTDSTSVRVAFGGDNYAFKAAAVTHISAHLGRGDNVFTSTANLPTLVVTADGRDRITTGDADDNVYSGAGSDR
ncbi:MAG: hypothetical protein JWM57_1367, partial [Phycisphaerales bacterium]|nr:hypothetical protein [Phycisphaerales bacterium]